MSTDDLRIQPSRRPEITEALIRQTGLTPDVIRQVVHSFYDRIRQDPLLGPIFAERITDWGPHLDQMVSFWSSVALQTGSYKGAPMPKHMGLPVDWVHFAHWLALFAQTTGAICTPEGAAHLQERAERIARSLHMGVREHAAAGGVPRF